MIHDKLKVEEDQAEIELSEEEQQAYEDELLIPEDIRMAAEHWEVCPSIRQPKEAP